MSGMHATHPRPEVTNDSLFPYVIVVVVVVVVVFLLQLLIFI